MSKEEKSRGLPVSSSTQAELLPCIHRLWEVTFSFRNLQILQNKWWLSLSCHTLWAGRELTNVCRALHPHWLHSTWIHGEGLTGSSPRWHAAKAGSDNFASPWEQQCWEHPGLKPAEEGMLTGIQDFVAYRGWSAAPHPARAPGDPLLQLCREPLQKHQAFALHLPTLTSASHCCFL